MAVNVALTHKIYVAQYDLSGDHAKVSVDDGVSELNAMVFGNTARHVVAGFYEPVFSGEGFVTFGATAVHTSLRNNLAVADVPVTVSPESGAVGETAIFMKAVQARYNVGGKVNEVLPFTVRAVGRGRPAIGGKIFVAAGNKSSSGTSSVIQLGTPSASQRVYAALHVLSASGTSPTLDVIVKSDDGSGFASPTNRITCTQATGATSEFKELAGPISDDYWRVDYTIGGTNPVFSFVVAVGIYY